MDRRTALQYGKGNGWCMVLLWSRLRCFGSILESPRLTSTGRNLGKRFLGVMIVGMIFNVVVSYSQQQKTNLGGTPCSILQKARTSSCSYIPQERVHTRVAPSAQFGRLVGLDKTSVTVISRGVVRIAMGTAVLISVLRTGAAPTIAGAARRKMLRFLFAPPWWSYERLQ